MTTTPKPTATATIEPMGRPTTVPREHLITVVIRLSSFDAEHGEKAFIGAVARKSLAGFAPAPGTPDRRGYGDVFTSTRAGRPGSVSSVVVGIEGSVIWSGRPSDELVEGLRAALAGEQYRVTLQETRACTEEDCSTDALVDWNRAANVPPGWYSNQICGRHNYRTCLGCSSVYVLTSTNSAGQAPSLQCAVCGAVMVEWGSSKIWNAELVSRGLV